MIIYLRFYCDKLKHRAYHEVKDVILKHFLRLGVYLSPSVFQLIIFFHSFRTTLYDHEIKDSDAQAMSHCRQRLLTS
jgi:predicted metal-dependent HD superfamily phosphohydrolase